MLDGHAYRGRAFTDGLEYVKNLFVICMLNVCMYLTFPQKYSTELCLGISGTQARKEVKGSFLEHNPFKGEALQEWTREAAAFKSSAQHCQDRIDRRLITNDSALERKYAQFRHGAEHFVTYFNTVTYES